ASSSRSSCSFSGYLHTRVLHSFPTRRSSDLASLCARRQACQHAVGEVPVDQLLEEGVDVGAAAVLVLEIVGVLPQVEREERRVRSEEHTSELQSLRHLVCRLLLEKKKKSTKH